MLRNLKIYMFLVFPIALAACTNSGQTMPQRPVSNTANHSQQGAPCTTPPVQAVQVTTSSLTVNVGGTASFTACAQFAGDFTLSASPSGIVSIPSSVTPTVDQDNGIKLAAITVTGVAAGTTTITVTDKKGNTATVVVTVAPSSSAVWVADTFSGNQLLHYAANANGNVSPTQAIAGGKHAIGVAFDSSGNLYVAEGNQGVEFYPAPLSNASIATRSMTPTAGPSGSGIGANAVAVQGTTLYVVGSYAPPGGPFMSNVVMAFPANWSGTSPTPTVIINTGINQPSTIAVDPNGNIYVANFGQSSSVVEFGPIGTQTGILTPAPVRTIAGSTIAPCGFVTGVSTDSSGNLYVNSCGTIAVFPQSTAVTTPTYTLSLSSGCGPYSVAVDNGGNIWALMCANNQQSILEFAAVSSGTTGLVFENPVLTLNTNVPQWKWGNELAIDPSGNLWTANDYATTITAYATTGLTGTVNPAAATTITQGPDSLFGPGQLAFDAAGNLWATNGGNGTIAELSPVAGSMTFANLLVPGIFGGCPSGIGFDTAGNMYVLDNCAQLVSVFSPPFASNLIPTRTLQVSGIGPTTQIALDAKNNLYLISENNNSVVIYPAGASGNATPLATITSSNGSIIQPTGLALDNLGNIYVYNSSGSGSISVFPPGSNGAATPSRTFTGMECCFFQLAVDSQRNVYVSNNPGFEVYSPTASGNATPYRKVTSSQQFTATGIVVSPK